MLMYCSPSKLVAKAILQQYFLFRRYIQQLLHHNTLATATAADVLRFRTDKIHANACVCDLRALGQIDEPLKCVGELGSCLFFLLIDS